MAKKSTPKKPTKSKTAKAKPARVSTMNLRAGDRHPVFAMKFAKVYPLYIRKAEAKGRTKKEVDQIICWLTGYNQKGLQKQIKQRNRL